MDWGTDCHLLSIITQMVSCHLMKALAYRTIRLSTHCFQETAGLTASHLSFRELFLLYGMPVPYLPTVSPMRFPEAAKPRRTPRPFYSGSGPVSWGFYSCVPQEPTGVKKQLHLAL